jgi:hypothetical protein
MMSARKILTIRCAPRRLPPAALLTTAILLGGCALNGDFDRPRPSLVSDDMHAWIGRDAVSGIGLPPSGFRLTDDERLLRDLAYPLIEPAYDRNRWYSVIGEYGFAHRRPPQLPAIEPTAYWQRLNDIYRRSESSFYNQIVTDARNDVIRLDPFFAVAGRVADMDGKRVQSLGFVSGLSAAERDDAVRRNAENAAVVAWVCRTLQERVVSYRYALERLVISTPSSGAAEADRAIHLLQRQSTGYCRPAAPARVAKS